MWKKKPPHPIFNNPYIKAVLRSLIFHAAYIAFAYILYLLILSNILRPMVEDGLTANMRWPLGLFSLTLFIGTQGLLISAYNKDGAFKRRYLELTYDSYHIQSPAGRRVLFNSIHEALLTAAIPLLLQIPSAVFYSAYGFDFVYALFFEKFQISWIGMDMLFGNAWLSMLITFVISFVFALAGRIFSHISWEENRIRKPHNP